MAEVGREDVAAFLPKPFEMRALIETLNNIFPESADPASQSARLIDTAPTVHTHLQGLHVLLVEDIAINREIAQELLTDAGLQVESAENGLIACQMVAQNGGLYAGILMDLQMPEMGGIEATARIRQKWSAEDMPIIAMTAHAYAEERERCFEAGMNDHIAKPVDPNILVQTLNKWLKPKNIAQVVEENPIPTLVIAAPSADLPEYLPPFDIPVALKRVNGKSSLLRKLIISFEETYGAVAEDLRQLIGRGQIDEARRLAHSLKGVAGSLELAAVHKMAADIERKLAAQNLEDISAWITALAQEIAPAAAAAKSLKSAPKIAEFSAPKTLDHAQVLAAASEFKTLLERRSLKARASFDILADTLMLSEDARNDHPIRVALERLDYPQALELLSTLISSLSSSSE